jgi:Flp pilus assembly protein TadG
MGMGWRKFVQGTEGVIMVYTALLLTVLLGFAGLVIDIGHYIVVQSELKKAADAGALAGVRALFPADMESATNPVSPDCSTALTVGAQTVQWNETDKAQTVVADIQTGQWDGLNKQFVAGCSSDPATFTNAVQVTTHRQDTPLYIMQALGVSPQTLQATSVAIKDWVGGLRPGGGFPIAIGEKYHKKGDLKIYLNDDNDDKGCWYVPGDSPSAFDSKLKELVFNQDLMPALRRHQWIYLDNGVVTSVINHITDNYCGKTVYLPVVKEIKFNQATKIEGFCGFTVTEVGKDQGKHYIRGDAKAITECPGNVADDSTGDDFGLLGPAKLVL